MVAKPINIFSGADTELGAALTNPTELSMRKGKISKLYDITYKGKRYISTEQAYMALKTTDAQANDQMMIECIAIKLRRHSELIDAIDANGALAWLEVCEHFTNAKSASFQSWEGVGRQSRFIRNLIAGYELAKSMNDLELQNLEGAAEIVAPQQSLF